MMDNKYDIANYLNTHQDQLKHFSNKLTESAFPTIKMIYADLTAFKDTRLGTLLCLTGSKYNSYIIENMEKYNKRNNRTFVESFPNIPYTEEQLNILWRDPKFSEYIFDYSPDTDVSSAFNELLIIINGVNSRSKYNGNITFIINVYPLQITKHMIAYSKILPEYLTSNISIKLISKDPTTVDKHIWEQASFIFLDDMEIHTKSTSTMYAPLYLEAELVGTHILAPINLTPDKIETLEKQGYDLTNEEQFNKLIINTEGIMNLWCDFNFCSYVVPITSTKSS